MDLRHGGRYCLYFKDEQFKLQFSKSALCFTLQTSLWRKLAGPIATKETLRRRNVCEQKNGTLSPRGRRGHSAHALKDCLLIYGGYKDFRGSTNELWAFHYGKMISLKVIILSTPHNQLNQHSIVTLSSPQFQPVRRSTARHSLLI